MTLILGIDTSTAVSVGLSDGSRTITTMAREGNRHVELLAPLVQELLAGAGYRHRDLTGVAVGLGPGPFTGLRVGIVAGGVLGSALGIPVVGTCSLDAIAAAAGIAGEFVAASDARRKELYWARYRDGVRVDGPHVGAAATLPDLPVVGPGALLYPDVLGSRARTDLAGPVDAAVLAIISVTCHEADLEPLYLRKPDATEPTGRKSAIAGVHEAGNR